MRKWLVLVGLLSSACNENATHENKDAPRADAQPGITDAHASLNPFLGEWSCIDEATTHLTSPTVTTSAMTRKGTVRITAKLDGRFESIAIFGDDDAGTLTTTCYTTLEYLDGLLILVDRNQTCTSDNGIVTTLKSLTARIEESGQLVADYEYDLSSSDGAAISGNGTGVITCSKITD